MNIHLSKDLERIVHDAVAAGGYAREDDVIRDALIRLKQTMPSKPGLSGTIAKRAKPARQNMSLTPDELNQRLLASGRITQLPDAAQDIDDDDPEDIPISIKGEPISETILRERR